MKYIKKFDNDSVSEHLQYHIDNNMSVTGNIFRYGSESYFKLKFMSKIQKPVK